MITITYVSYIHYPFQHYSEFCLYLCIILWAGWDLSMQELHNTVKTFTHILTTTTTATATTIITYIKITIHLLKSKTFLHYTSREQWNLGQNSPKKSEYLQGQKWGCALHIFSPNQVFSKLSSWRLQYKIKSSPLHVDKLSAEVWKRTIQLPNIIKEKTTYLYWS